MSTQQNGNSLVVQGRIVWTSGNSLFEGKKKLDYNTNQPEFNDDGTPVVEYGFGLSIPKIDPRTGQATAEFQKIWQALHQEAFTLYPSGQLPPDFAMKFKDGDGVDHKGQPFGDREGYKGCIVLACTTRIPIKFFRFEGGNNILVNDGIKCGDYVNVQINIKAHPAKGRGKAGLYLNPSAVQMIQAGKEIINMPSGDQLFGMVAPTYAGEVIAHVAPSMPNAAAPMMPNTAGQGGYSAPPAYAQPASAPAPHYGVVPPTHQPQQGNGYAAPVPSAPMPSGQNNMGQTYAQPAYPSNPAMPPMPGMPR